MTTQRTERESRTVAVIGSGYYGEPIEVRLSSGGITTAMSMTHDEARELVRLLKPWIA